MASSSGTKSSLTGLKTSRWLKDLTDELQENFPKFALHLGFTESQVDVVKETGQTIFHQVILKWLHTIGRHTTHHLYVIYTALDALHRRDLLDKYFKGGTPTRYSDDIWQDFLDELHAVDISNLEDKDQNGDKNSEVEKKKRKNRKRTKKKCGSEHGTTEKDKEMVNLEDSAVLPCSQQMVSSSEHDQGEDTTEKDKEMVNFEDSAVLPCSQQMVSSSDKNAEVEKKKRKSRKRTKKKCGSEHDQGEDTTEKDKEMVNLEDSAVLPCSQQMVSSSEHDQGEEATEKDKEMVDLEDSAALPCSQQIVSSSDLPQKQVSIETTEGNVIVGDHATMNITNYNIRLQKDDGEENMKKEVYAILQEKGAVGNNAEKNKVNLQTLETCFHRRTGKHFDSMYGKALLTYLHNTDVFTLTKKSNQWFIHVDESAKNKTQECAHTKGIYQFPKENRRKPPSEKNEQRSEKHAKCTTHTRPKPIPSVTSTYKQSKCKEFGDFLDFVGNFRDGNYILMISKLDFIKHEEALACVPWLCVFDFDVNSFTEGLYFRTDNIFRENRGALYPCTWKDPPNIQTFGTEWCFVSGSTHSVGSSTPESFKEWYSHIRKDFEKHIEEITTLLDTIKPLTVVAFWPEDHGTGKKYHKIISVLNETVRPFPQVVVVADNPTEQSKSLIELLEPNYQLQEKMEHVFHDLAANLGERRKPGKSKYRLCSASGGSVSIESSQAASFSDSIQVLYLNNPFQTNYSDLFASEEQEKLFFKGGNLCWEAYYNSSPGHFYVPRDICPEIVNDIKKSFIDCMKPGEITIFHAPGAGGTTLGQNIIWELHTLTPCVQVRSDTLVKPKEVARHISKLWRETHLPIVMLFDELNDTLFDNIQRKLNDICVIFINLKRVSEEARNLQKYEYFLPGALSANEAKRMGPKFTRCCENDIEKKDQIQKLVDDIIAGNKHHLIEFGLVTYLHEYTGVPAYVSQYLKLDQYNKALDRSRTVLGYLSLVHVFGQGTMSCQLFGTMMGRTPDFTFTYDKFPQMVKEFTVPVESEFIRNSVRICHYLIAQEILEQLLSKNPSEEMSQDLSMLAKQNLQFLVLEFITDLKNRQDKVRHMSKAVFDIILQTFIYREDRSPRDQQRQGRSKFSRLIESIPSEQPFSERLKVMETLAESFPGSPSLWAHFGRALTILRPNERKNTETCFQKAITGCQEGQNLTIMDNDESDNVMSYVFHMYGTFYRKMIREDINNCNPSNEMQFQDVVRHLIKLADTACESFENSRKLRYAGFQESLGCFGIIDVRLAICEFLKRYYKFATIPNLLDVSKNSEITSFVEKSLTLVQQLFLQCYNVVDHNQIGDDFNRRIALYNSLFKDMVPNNYMDSITVPDTIDTRGVVVAAIKLNYGKGGRLGTVQDITKEEDIKRVISLLEQNFNDIKRTGEFPSKTGTDHDFLDWIHAIRLENQRKSYSVADVLEKVQNWFTSVRSPYSRLYLFILLFVYAISQDGRCKRDIIKEAISLREDSDWTPVTKTLANPKRPREWLGKEPGIRCLLPGKSFEYSMNSISDKGAKYQLLVLKGTIRLPNTYRIDGFINMDIEGNPGVPVAVHFSPMHTKEKLIGSAFANRRVQFMLAFTPQFGLEAYNVTELKKSTCKHCNSKVEITGVERSKTCKCGKMVDNEFPMSL